MTKKLFIRTYGCQMNVYDSARMADVLGPLGYAAVDTPEAADMVIVNTCHIRENASVKTFSELGRLKQIKQQKDGDYIIAVAGCVAQAEGEEILARAPYVDIVLGPQTYHRLPEMVARAERGAAQKKLRSDIGANKPAARIAGMGILDTDFPVEAKFDFLPAPTEAQGVTAFLSIQEGCDKFCTFCVVPYTRGAEYSRSVAQILTEAEQLVALGVRELTLLGQNVNAYHGDGPNGDAWTLAQLAYRLAEIPGLERIRYTTSHPRDMDDALIAAHGDLPQLMPFLHLPVQSGSDTILAAMNRQHTADHYRRIIDKLRAARPDLCLSTDLIVGFPGESDADFAATMQLVRDVTFPAAFSFKYSGRPGTPAATMAGQVPEEVKDARLAELNALLLEQLNRFNRSLVGQTVPVLFEKAGRHAGQMVGRSPYLQPVHVQGEADLVGRVRLVAIEQDHSFSLSGRLVAEPVPDASSPAMRMTA